MKFVLNRPQSDRPISSRLPFWLGRKLGEVGATPIVTPVVPVEPPKPDVPKNPFKPLIGFDRVCVVDNAVAIEHCQNMSVNGDKVANCQNINRTDGVVLANHFIVWQSVFYPVANCQNTSTIKPVSLANCAKVWQIGQQSLTNCTFNPVTTVVHYGGCVAVFDSIKHHFSHCQIAKILPIISHDNCSKFTNHGHFLTRCQSTSTSPTVSVPCRYYPIPEPPPIPIVGKCRIRPPSNRLPFNLARKRNGLLSNQLPFSMMCWHDDVPQVIPNVRTYVVKNTITATLGGVVFSPVGFSVRTDMNSYCWQGSVELSSSEYAKVQQKLNTERGNEPLISIDINGFLFSIIAEEISRSRAFVNHSYNIGGRSATARLGADYAVAKSDIINMDNYASQIINSQLVDLPFSVERFEIADWLIPANSYAISNKTPIAVIHDIVSACGGFVWSDPNLPKLYLQKRWKVNAWELATANPDVVLSVDVVQSISDQKRTNPRYNTVTLVSDKQAGEVFRERQGRDRIAPIDNHDLYTDRDCIIPKGCQILSDSGTHADYSLVMRWTDKYNIKLAELGQIWQINDPEGAFKGVVTSVAVDVRLENDVPTVWQTVGIDRYMDG